MTKIKLCGLMRPQDIEAVNQAKPDFAGFVFAPSKRNISPRHAADLKKLLSPDIPAVGVFSNTPDDLIISLAKDKIIDLIQLHGNESETSANYIKEETGLPIIRAVRVRNTEDINHALHFPCDYLLLDTYVKNQYGGSGMVFDWNMIPPIEKPWFLAGGLGMNNLKEAAETGAWCLDISSAAETDGFKDPKKIKELIKTIRSIA